MIVHDHSHLELRIEELKAQIQNVTEIWQHYAALYKVAHERQMESKKKIISLKADIQEMRASLRDAIEEIESRRLTMPDRVSIAVLERCEKAFAVHVTSV